MEECKIKNAGLCLFAPFIPSLFERTKLLKNDRTDFKDPESRIRAVFILQHLASYEYNASNEDHLIFNRMLVNLPINLILPQELKLTDLEIKITDSLLETLKEKWYKMSHTSIRAIQSTFIEREGQLKLNHNRWELIVNSSANDLLLDSFPWPYGLMRFPWLEEVIFVNWSK